MHVRCPHPRVLGVCSSAGYLLSSSKVGSSQVTASTSTFQKVDHLWDMTAGKGGTAISALGRALLFPLKLFWMKFKNVEVVVAGTSRSRHSSRE
jgi:ABC-type metal ion transport system substrate-binding protein